MIDAYWQFELKPWDVAAGVLILEEAGGRISTCDGLAYSVSVTYRSGLQVVLGGWCTRL